MPSKKQTAEANEVKKLFEKITVDSKPVWKCLVPKCEKIYKSDVFSVRRRHLQDSHLAVLTSIEKKVNEQFDVEPEHSSDDENAIRIKMSRKRVVDACVEMVTKNGMPFAAMNSSGFIKLLNPILDGLSSKGQPVTINRNNIKTFVQNRADDTVERIKKELKGRQISLMMDMATRHNRSVLGITTQYLLNDDIVVRTLAMDHIKTSHSGEELKKRLLAVLEKYGIQIQQVYAITTDNGSNMLKTTELMNDMLPAESGGRIENVLQMLNEGMAGIEDQDDEFSSDENEETVAQKEAEANLQKMREAIENIIAGSSVLSFINAISCAAHTLQLGIRGAIADEDFADGNKLIQKCKKLTRTLRVPSVATVIKGENYLQAKKNVNSRWNSELIMMKSLLHLRQFCVDWGDIVIEKKKRDRLLTAAEWCEVEEIVKVLEWPYILTEQLQAEQLTLSDVYGNWITMELKLQKEHHELAGLLIKHLAPRRDTIFNNPAMIAAVYLDPRFNRLLSLEKRNEAAQFLQQLWTRLATAREPNEAIEENTHCNIENGFSDEGIDADLLAHVRLNDERFAQQSGSSNATEKRVETQLIKFFQNETLAGVQKAKSILGYWAGVARYEYDELFELARVVLTAPATQVSVERAFSALRYILNDYRTSLGSDSLENILVIRLNSDL